MGRSGAKRSKQNYWWVRRRKAKRSGEWQVVGARRVRGEDGGWENFINEEMSDEQRQTVRPLSA